MNTRGLEWSSYNGLLMNANAYPYEILVWNTTTYTQIATLTGHSNTVTDLQLRDNSTLISSSKDNTINMWSLTTKLATKTYTNGYPVNCIKLVPTRSLVASGDTNTQVKIWDLSGSSTATALHTLTGHTNVIYALELIDPYTLASASEDHTVIVWSLSTWTSKLQFTQHTAGIYSLKLIGTDIMASGDNNGKLFIWNTTNGNVLHTLVGHSNIVSRMDLLSSNVLVSVSSDKTIRMWNTTTGTLLKTIKTNTAFNSVKMSKSYTHKYRFFFFSLSYRCFLLQILIELCYNFVLHLFFLFSSFNKFFIMLNI